MKPLFVIITCPDSSLREDVNEKELLRRLQLAVKNEVGPANDAVAAVKAITHRVVSASYRQCLSAAKEFFPTTAEIIIDPNANGQPQPLDDAEATSYLQSTNYIRKKTLYHERGQLCYTFGIQRDKAVVAVVPCSYYQAAKGDIPIHVLCDLGQLHEKPKMEARGNARYWDDVEEAKIAVGYIRGIKPILRRQNSPSALLSEASVPIQSIVSKHLSPLLLCSPPAPMSLPAAPDFPLESLQRQTEECRKSTKSLLASLQSLLSLVSRKDEAAS